MTSAAAKKAWESRRRHMQGHPPKSWIVTSAQARKAQLRNKSRKSPKRRFSKVQALMDGFGYTRKEAIAALKDMGE